MLVPICNIVGQTFLVRIGIDEADSPAVAAKWFKAMAQLPSGAGKAEPVSGLGSRYENPNHTSGYRTLPSSGGQVFHRIDAGSHRSELPLT